MPTGLSDFARRFLTNAEVARATLTAPLLVWEAGSASEDEERLLLDTRSGLSPRRPRAGEPVVFDVKKGSHKANAFAMGVTIGRTETNDIPIEDESVSRFHAWLAESPKGWKLVDAESKNGTWVGAMKLPPNQGEVVQDGARIRLGDVELIFMLPDTFVSYLDSKLGK